VFELPEGAGEAKASVTAAGKPVQAAVRRDGRRVTLTLAKDVVIQAGEVVEADLTW